MKKRIISILLTAIMIVGMIPQGAISASAEGFDGMTYYGLKDGKITEMNIPENAVDISLDTDFSQGGVFVLRESVTFSGKIRLGGDTTIILCDNAVLTSKGIGAPADGNLTICATTFSTDETAGRISVETAQNDWHATCIGTQDYDCGDITIVGGVFDLTNTEGNAAIGSVYSSCGDINILGGKINITLLGEGAGIGAGYGDAACGDINISGGDIYIKMLVPYCCGIGNYSDYGTCENINISGGDIKIEPSYYSTGIGLIGGTCEDINISGGNIEIKIGQESAGIGSSGGKCKNITVSGGDIEITYDKAEVSEDEDVPEEIITGVGAFAGYGRSVCGNITLEGGNINISFLTESGSIAVGAVDIEGQVGGNSAKCGKISESPFYNKFSVKTSPTESSVMYVEQMKDFDSKPVTCGEDGHKAAFYNSADELFYEDDTFTKKIGTFSELYRWAVKGEGVIPATGEHVDNGNGICKNCGRRFRLPKEYYGLDGKEIITTSVPSDAVALTGEETEFTGKTYVVADDVTYDGRIIFTEDTLLIICENKTLTAEGISVVNEHSLTIASTTPDKDEMGKIVISAQWEDENDYEEHYEKFCIAAIGSYSDPSASENYEAPKAPDVVKYCTAGDITILGGIIEFDYEECSAETLIGAGYFSTCGDINIYGGYIKAGDDYYYTCIGTTREGTCGDINIYGGEIIIDGMNSGAAIGTGYTGKCGNITVTGGRIKIGSIYDGVGIGAIGKCGKITVTGGDIAIEGLTESTGIGAGAGGYFDYDLQSSVEYSGICDNIEITGGKIYITTCYEHAGINQGGDNSVAIGAGKNTYNQGDGKYVTIGSTCGDIMISDGDVEIYVPVIIDGEIVSGDGNNNIAIGAADVSECGNIKIDSALEILAGESRETAVVAQYTNQKYVHIAVHIDANGNNVCDVCKEVIDKSIPAITDNSLSLGSDIYLNFYMSLPEDAIENGTMSFDIGGIKVEGAKPVYSEASDKYYFSCPLNALEMNEAVTATFTYGGKSYEQTYSGKQYIDALLTREGTDDKTRAAKDLAKKVMNYGFYTQDYLSSIHSDVTIGAGGFAAMPKSDVDISAESKTALLQKEFEAPEAAGGISLIGRSVNFDSATALNYYVTVEGSQPEATCEDKTVEVKQYSGKIYIVTVLDIKAIELETDFTVTITGTSGSLSITSSVLDYCADVVRAHNIEGATEDDIKAVDAMTAFYEYYLASKAYAEK